jgi:hypothetical protein
VNNFMNGGSFGCACNSRHLHKWSDRRGEVQARCDERNAELLISPEEWPQKITGINSLLSMRCRVCDTTVKTKSVNKFVNNGRFGCACNSNKKRKKSPEDTHESSELEAR